MKKAIQISRAVEYTKREMEDLNVNEEVAAVYARPTVRSTAGNANSNSASQPAHVRQYCGTSHKPKLSQDKFKSSPYNSILLIFLMVFLK